MTESVDTVFPQKGEGICLRVKRSRGIPKGGIHKVAMIEFEPRRVRVIGETDKSKGSIRRKGGKGALGGRRRLVTGPQYKNIQ